MTANRIQRDGSAFAPLRLCVLALIFILLINPFTQAQEKPQTPPPRESAAPSNPPKEPARESAPTRAANVLVTGEEDYRIGAGDVIDIRVVDAEELSGTFRVRADGTIKMHFLGRLVVLDKTSEDLSKIIADGLRGRYLFEPRVSVNITELNSRNIYIQGAVNKPGVYQIDGRPHMLQLLVMAGGLLPNYGSTAFIIRRVKVSEEDIKAHEASLKAQNQRQGDEQNGAPSDQPKLQDAEWLSKQYTLIKLNINGLFKGRFDQNMFLQPGDIVNIPSTETFFVSGQVKAPGSFPLKEGTSLRMAIALAQGFTNTSSPGKGIIFRENPETGKRVDLQVDMGAVMAGKQEDMMIYPNDVLVVPGSGFKTWTVPLIQASLASVLQIALIKALGY
jgi:polysaccharide export outer membrane protein